jgi:hypothetical protein
MPQEWQKHTFTDLILTSSSASSVRRGICGASSRCSTPAYLVWAPAAVAALTIGLDSWPEVASNEEVVRMLLGSSPAPAIPLAIVAEVSSLLRSNVQRIVGS